ncbi:hypothetical protein H072_1814 [Dactylellina haptotyla CBS 200.50]|uniref:F-box domain-containing protein n=1 Tax=Dactylellina haptotyla (strain CBS 200.50) TaxID=1284197 RepID=S8AMV7_DACHA|nr:hypothetical protein H072_1814 [Dactylellina haptotyla CBS 200.50]
MVLFLPPELQIQILSYLNIEDQVHAATVCPLWRTLLKTRSILQTRYFEVEHANKLGHEPKARVGPPGMHQIIQYKDRYSVFGCIVQSGAVKEYFVGRRVPEFVLARRPREKVVDAKDITRSPVLDDPIFSPFMRDKAYLKSSMELFRVGMEFRPGFITLRSLGPGLDVFSGQDTTLRQMVEKIARVSEGDLRILLQQGEKSKTRMVFTPHGRGFQVVVTEISNMGTVWSV